MESLLSMIKAKVAFSGRSFDFRLTSSEKMDSKLNLGKVPRPQLSLEFVEPDPLSHTNLLFHFVIMLHVLCEAIVEGPSSYR